MIESAAEFLIGPKAGVRMLRSAAAPNPESNHATCATKTCFMPTSRNGAACVSVH